MKKRKRLLSLLTALCMLLTMFPLSGLTAFAVDGSLTGSGAADDPYLIADAADLKAFRDIVNGGDTDACGKLTADIVLNTGDLSGYDGTSANNWEQWTPIGDLNYTGTFDGCGHTVSGIYINNASIYQGMFCRISGGTVKNVGVINSYIHGGDYTGGVAGDANGSTVTNCYNSGAVNGDSFVGGVVGYVCRSSITNCYNAGTVSGNMYVGGMIGEIDYSASVINSYNTGTVSAAGEESEVGGVAGELWNNASVTNCYNTGAVSASGENSYVGGVAGMAEEGIPEWGEVSGTVTNCYYLNTSVYAGIGYGSGDATAMEQADMQSADFITDLNGGQDPAPWEADMEVYPLNNGYPIFYWQAPFDGGTGTVEDPYLIADATDLKAFAALVNSGNTSVCGRLVNDIVLNDDLDQSKFAVEVGYDNYDDPVLTVTYDGSTEIPAFEQWVPIGDARTPYTGTFDGDGCSVSGVYTDGHLYYGLFGCIGDGAVVTDTTVANSFISAADYIGGIAGYVEHGAVISGCRNESFLYSVSFQAVLGGIAGHNYGEIKNCVNTGDILSVGIRASGIAGVTGQNDAPGSITGCYNTGTVIAASEASGISFLENGSIENCYNTGDARSANRYGSAMAGGIAAGVSENGSMENCFSTGNISAELDFADVGGVAGSVDGTVSNCYYLAGTADAGVGYGTDTTSARTAQQMTGTNAAVNLKGFDFDTVWCASTAQSAWQYIGENEQNNTLGDYSNDADLPQLKVFVQNGFEVLADTCTGLQQVTEDHIKYYIIYNSDQLELFAAIVNGTLGDTDKSIYTEGAAANAVLAADIDMSGVSWSGISTSSLPYTGIFDCRGHTLSNLTGTEALFAYNAGTIKNVRLTNVSISRGGNNLGAVAGLNVGTVFNCVTSGTVTLTGGYSAGGIVGYNNSGTVSGCYSVCTISGYNPGGLIGSNNGGGIVISSVYLGTAGSPIEGDNMHGNKTDVFYKDENGAWHKVNGADNSTVTTNSTANEAVTSFNDYVRANNGYFLLSAEGDIYPVDLSGSGTQDNPYLIYDADQLKTFRNIVNDTLTQAEAECYAPNSGACGKLMADIVLNEHLDMLLFGTDEDGNVTYDGSTDIPDFEQWDPIGDPLYYLGTFDGNGKTVSGIYINTSERYQGLFGYLNNSTVKNLGVINSYIRGGNYAGGVVGGVDEGTSVTNCYNTGAVSAFDDYAYVGGVAGFVFSSGSVANCYNTGTVSAAGEESEVGGVAGELWNNASVTNCYNTGAVSASGENSYVGGVAGCVENSNVTNCYYLAGTAEAGTGSGSGEVTSLTAQEITGQSAVGTMQFDATVWSAGQDKAWQYQGVSEEDETLGVYTKTMYLPQLTVCAENGNETLSDQTDGLQQVTEQAEDGGTITYYLIYNAGQLALFRDIVNGTLPDDMDKEIYTVGAASNGRLVNNIDLNPGTVFNPDGTYTDGTTPVQWTPIGTSTTVYAGTFDGNNKSVIGIYINTSERYQGFFGRIGSSGAVRNLSVLNSSVTGVESVGSIAGESNGRIENCTNAAIVTASSSHAGGIVGACMSNSAVIANCTNSGNVKGSTYVGGIAGRSYANIAECANTGNVEGSSAYGVGGIVGITSSTYSVTVENCYNTGDISSTCKSVAYVGGIVGSFQNANARGTIRNCYNTGKVTADAESGVCAGGLLGGGYGNIYNSFSTGTVTGNTYVGGVGGFVNGTVENAYYLSGSSVAGIGYGSEVDAATEITAVQMTGPSALTNMSLDSSVWTAGQDTVWQYQGVSEEDETLGVYTGTGYLPQLSVFQDIGNETLSLTKTDLIQQTDDEDGKTYYLIYNAPNLKAFRDKVNGGETDANGRLVNNIDLNPGTVFNPDGTYTDGTTPAQWEPIGSNSHRFAGTFDGNGYIIRGIYINNSNDNQGIFGYLENGTVKNLGLDNGYIRGNNNTAAIAGTSRNSNILNCFSILAVNGLGAVGGIAGANYGTVANCYNAGSVTASGKHIGGITGYNERAVVSNCYNTGTVSATGVNSDVGGIAGFGGIVTNCYYLNTGSSTGIGNGSGEATSVTIAEIEDTSDNGLLAKLASGSGSGVWNETLSAVTNWEYDKPAVQPVLIWQQAIENAPVYTVTIPEKATAGGDAVHVTMYAGALRTNQQVYVSVAEDNDFNLYYGGDKNNYSILYNAYVNGGSTALAAGALVLSGGNMQSGGNAESAALTFTAAETPKFAGDYTGTITFTVSVENAA